MGEEGAEDEEKDSSQVIALDEISEESAGAPLGVGGRANRACWPRILASGWLTPGAVPVGVVSPAETPFSMWNVMGLASCLMLLGLCGMMVYDLLRNIWSWDERHTLNSSLLEVLNPFL